MSSIAEVLVRMMVRGMLSASSYLGLSFTLIFAGAWLLQVDLLEAAGSPAFFLGVLVSVSAFLGNKISDRLVNRLLPSLEDEPIEERDEPEPL